MCVCLILLLIAASVSSSQEHLVAVYTAATVSFFPLMLHKISLHVIPVEIEKQFSFNILDRIFRKCESLLGICVYFQMNWSTWIFVQRSFTSRSTKSVQFKEQKLLLKACYIAPNCCVNFPKRPKSAPEV